MAVTHEDQDRIQRLQNELWTEKQKNLNLTDALIGATAVQAQAKQDNEDLFHRLHVTSTRLNRLLVMLGYDDGTPFEQVEGELARPLAAGSRIIGRLGGHAVDSMVDTMVGRGAVVARRMGFNPPGRDRGPR